MIQHVEETNESSDERADEQIIQLRKTIENLTSTSDRQHEKINQLRAQKKTLRHKARHRRVRTRQDIQDAKDKLNRTITCLNNELNDARLANDDLRHQVQASDLANTRRDVAADTARAILEIVQSRQLDQDRERLQGTVTELEKRVHSITAERDAALRDAARLSGVQSILQKDRQEYIDDQRLRDGLIRDLKQDMGRLEHEHAEVVAAKDSIIERKNSTIFHQQQWRLEKTREHNQQVANLVRGITEAKALANTFIHMCVQRTTRNITLACRVYEVERYSNAEDTRHLLLAQETKLKDVNDKKAADEQRLTLALEEEVERRAALADRMMTFVSKLMENPNAIHEGKLTVEDAQFALESDASLTLDNLVHSTADEQPVVMRFASHYGLAEGYRSYDEESSTNKLLVLYLATRNDDNIPPRETAFMWLRWLEERVVPTLICKQPPVDAHLTLGILMNICRKPGRLLFAFAMTLIAKLGWTLKFNTPERFQDYLRNACKGRDYEELTILEQIGYDIAFASQENGYQGRFTEFFQALREWEAPQLMSNRMVDSLAKVDFLTDDDETAIFVQQNWRSPEMTLVLGRPKCIYRTSVALEYEFIWSDTIVTILKTGGQPLLKLFRRIYPGILEAAEEATRVQIPDE